MKIYAETPARRTRQLVADVAVLVWVIGWVAVARTVYTTVDRLAAAGRSVEDAGNGLAGSLNDAAGQARRLPVVGDKLAAPLRGAGDAANQVANAGVAQQSAVARLALVLALIVAVLPIGWLLIRWLPARIRWVRTASAAARSRDAEDVDLLALRALAHRPLWDLQRVDPRPGAAYARDDRDVIARLAALELATVGLRARPDPRGPRSGGNRATG